MAKNILVLITGIIIGAVATAVLKSNDRVSIPQESAIEETENSSNVSVAGAPGRSPASGPAAGEKDGEKDGDTLTRQDHGSGSSAADGRPDNGSVPDTGVRVLAIDPEFALAEPYASMVRPPARPDKLRTPELYERFLNDVRDNAWADAMEAGMRQFEAEAGARYETAFESVACRSRYCVIAGVSYSQEPRPWNPIMSELAESGWWQGSGGTSISATTHGTETRFISIIAREHADTLRSSDTEIRKDQDSSVQAPENALATG